MMETKGPRIMTGVLAKEEGGEEGVYQLKEGAQVVVSTDQASGRETTSKR